MTPAELKAIRKTLKLTQQGMADALGLSLGAIRKYEQGDRPIPGPVILLLENPIVLMINQGKENV